jgi:hypothetical protein
MGFDVGANGIDYDPADAYLYESLFALLGASLSLDRIPDRDLEAFGAAVEGMSRAHLGWGERREDGASGPSADAVRQWLAPICHYRLGWRRPYVLSEPFDERFL